MSVGVWRGHPVKPTLPTVIADVDHSLARFFAAALPKETTVSFDTPSEQWSKAVGRPTVSFFLHRIVEDIDRRAADWLDERDGEGRVASRQPPIRHYQLHYQVSAWAASVADEHRLLGDVMDVCLGGEIVPREHLTGSLDVDDEPLLMRLAQPVSNPGPQPHDVWESLGLPLRASFELVLVAPLRPRADTDIAPPAEELTLGIEDFGRGKLNLSDDGRVAERRWTTFRIREKSSSDDPGLDRVRHRM